MPFYTPTENRFTRAYRDEVDVAFSAMDCVLCSEPAIYASTELTTGSRLYRILRETETRTAADLREKKGKEWFTANVWVPNVEAAMAFAEIVRRAHDHRTPVVTPAPFTAPGWTQPEYLAFWETLLRTRIKAAWFNRNWQFSNGCTFEYAVARDAGLLTCDSEGRPLEADTATGQITEAIRVLEEDGFETATLRENLNRILAILQHDRAVIER
jgi:hypothetical protein